MAQQGFPNSPLDGTYIKDDFLSNSGVLTATVGELGWVMTTIANASTASFVAGQNGILRDTTQGTTGDGEAYTLMQDKIVLTGTNQSVRFRVRYPTVSGNVLAGNNFRIGFSDVVTAGEPTVGIWVDSAAGVIELDAASAANTDRNQAVAGISTFTAGTTMVIDTWHDFAFFCTGTNSNGGPQTIKLFIDGELGATISDCTIGSAETMELSIIHWNSGSLTAEFDIDYIEAWLPRN